MARNFDPRSLDELARKLAESVPPQLKAVKQDLETNFKSVLQAGLAKLDLVTRQEFDVQTGVLHRTREKLSSVEERLTALEAEMARREQDARERVELPPEA